MLAFKSLLMALIIALSLGAIAQTSQRVVDVPTRQGVTQRILFLFPAASKATLLLFAGGHGGLHIFPNGSLNWGEGNFLIRTRQLFVDQGVAVAVVDAPSDRQSPPYLAGFRQKPEHAADIKALIAWARDNANVPVWLVGTSRGTQSVAYLATELQGPEGPDGIVLSSTILTDPKGRPVPAMPLARIRHVRNSFRSRAEKARVIHVKPLPITVSMASSRRSYVKRSLGCLASKAPNPQLRRIAHGRFGRARSAA